MGIIVTSRRQKAVYWAPKARPDNYGQQRTHMPIEIDCRWDDTQETFVDSGGREAVSRASVAVDQQLVMGGFLFRGTLLDLDGVLDVPNDAFEIRRVIEIPNLKNTEVYRAVTL